MRLLNSIPIDDLRRIIGDVGMAVAYSPDDTIRNDIYRLIFEVNTFDEIQKQRSNDHLA